MSDESWIWSCDESIPSQRGAGQAIVTLVLDQLKSNDWSERDVFGIHLALEEALVNAIIHGNGLDAGKEVLVKCRLDADRLRVEIRDQGTGFQAIDVPDPTDCENIERPCGRGIMLMRSFMTTVEYNDSGNCVSMEKQRSADEDAASDQCDGGGPSASETNGDGN